MRVLISADMEGATGVTFPDDCEPGSPRWEYYRVLFAGGVNAAIGGFFDAGPDEVLVNEAHSSQRNLLLDQLDDRATLLIGRHKPLAMMEGTEDAKPYAPAAQHVAVKTCIDRYSGIPMVTGIPGVRQVAERQVAFELPTMREAIRCFRALTQVASGSIEKTYG